MNFLMGGMIPVAALAWQDVAEARDPTHGLFWFRMSIALMAGFAAAYPMNWWLVAHHLKHGIMTVPSPSGAQQPATRMPMARRRRARSP